MLLSERGIFPRRDGWHHHSFGGSDRDRDSIPQVLAALGIHHLGVAVRDVDAAVQRYRQLLGAEVDHEDVVEDQGVHAVALRVGEGPLVELLAPLADDTPVGRFLQKRGEGMHHVAYRVDGLGRLARPAGRRRRGADRRAAPQGPVRAAGRIHPS